MEDDKRRRKEKEDRRKKDRKKSRSKSSRSSSSSRSASRNKKKKGKKNFDSKQHNNNMKQREPKPELQRPENDYTKQMMPTTYPGYSMYDPHRKPPGPSSYDIHPPTPMMHMPTMNRAVYPPYPVPTGYPPVQPPMYPRGVAPPLPGQSQPPIEAPRMPPTIAPQKPVPKPYVDPKMPVVVPTPTIPVVKKEKEKTPKKEENTGKLLDIEAPKGARELFKTIQFSAKQLSEPLLLNVMKGILSDLEGRLKEKKIKNVQKDIQEYLAALPEKIKEIEKKKKSSSSSSEHKVTEQELIKALHDNGDLEVLLNLVNVEKFQIEDVFDKNNLMIKESKVSSQLLEDACSLFQ